jgi:serine protease Do
MSPVMRRVSYAAAAFGAALGVLWLIDREIFKPGREQGEKPETIVLEQRPRVEAGMLPSWSALNAELALVTERVMPCVVSVQVQRRRMVPEEVNRGGSFHTEEREISESGVGSGSIISRDGYVLTNWHVVEGGENSVYVTLSGEESSRAAKLVDKDEQRDLALLKIEPRREGEQFPALRLGDSGKLRRGHLVLAMGSPFGLRETVTQGIISHRARRVSDTYTSYLQTSCVINPGNSGGPLVDVHGDMVGLVTKKLLGPEEQASAEGYGLAIPSSDLMLVLDGLMNKGRPQPYVGVTLEDWPERYWLKQEEAEAVAVKGVTRASPAEKAGLKLDDIIEVMDGERVTNIYDFWRRVRLHKAGDTLSLTIRRGKEAQQASLVLTNLPESSTKAEIVYGVTVRRLRSYERNLLNLADATGLRVEEVAPESPLAKVLSRRMNVLLVATPDGSTAITVATPEEFRKALEERAESGGNIIIGEAGEENRAVKFPPLKGP